MKSPPTVASSHWSGRSGGSAEDDRHGVPFAEKQTALSIALVDEDGEVGPVLSAGSGIAPSLTAVRYCACIQLAAVAASSPTPSSTPPIKRRGDGDASEYSAPCVQRPEHRDALGHTWMTHTRDFAVTVLRPTIGR